MTRQTAPGGVQRDDSQRPASRPGERSEVSYLVRFWLEPRENEGESAPLRGYARDLRTGEERYFGDPRRLGELILRRLRATRQEESDREETERAVG